MPLVVTSVMTKGILGYSDSLYDSLFIKINLPANVQRILDQMREPVRGI
jgi:hypothetical protein